MKKRSLFGNESFPFACLGMGFIYAWTMSSVFLNANSPNITSSFLGSWMSFPIGGILGFLFFLLSEKHLGELSLNSHIQLSSMFVVSFGTLISAFVNTLPLETLGQQFSLVSDVASALSGVGMVPFLIAWCCVFKRMDAAQAEVVIPLNIVIAMAIAVLLGTLADWYLIFATALLPILSFTFLRKALGKAVTEKPSGTKPDEPTNEMEENVRKIPWAITALLITFWVACGISRYYTIPNESSSFPEALLVLFSIGVVAAVIVCFVFLFFSNKVSFFSIVRIILPISCASLLLIPLVPNTMLPIAFVMSFIALINIDIYVFILASALAREGGFSCTHIVGGLRLAIQGGGLIGGVLIYLTSGISMSIVVSFMAVLLVVVVMLAARDLDVFEGAVSKNTSLTLSSSASAKDELVARCEKLGSRFGLSQRETEILQFLGKGRDAPYIRDALYISRNTVNTHVKRIYRKLNIHSKQELLDMIEDPEVNKR